MTPVRYQAKATGDWERWIKGHVDPGILQYKVNIHNESVFINGCQVYALIGEDQRVWNCSTGWQRKGML